MGLFDFIKNVGEKIKGHDNNDDAPKAEDLKKSLDALDLGANNVQVKVDGHKAILTGDVKDQATMEKAVLVVGNYHGIEQVNTDGLKIDAGPEISPVFYTVRPGDSLSKIAETQYGKGNANKYPLIFEANKPMLSSPDKIYPGQVLRIPALDEAKKTTLV